MNAKCYRTVFNAARGMLVAVEESARSTGKGRGAGSRASRRRASALTLTAAAALAAPGLNAQSLTPDRSVPGPHPVVGVAANGTPVVNINAPSAAGVSSNAFTHYNVGQAGVVLNNSGQNSQTQIAGWVQGNPFLGNNSARVILNQVTSGNPSTLAGPTEIAGNRANLIVANPAGIICSGCSFIQAPRVTLTTGTPNFDALGNLSSLSVQQGQITVNGAGLDARGAQLDLLSRAMAINGAVWAERLNAVAGANSVDYGSVTPTAIAGTGPAPQVAIDVGQLGSMFGGGATRLIGTEQGLGVNIGGNLAALTGRLDLSANGDVTITPTGRVQSAADLAIAAPNVTNQGAISTPGNVSISGSTANTGSVVAGGNVAIAGPQITNTGTIGAGVDANGGVTQAGSVALNAAGTVRNGGSLLAGQDIGVSAGSIDTGNGSVNARGAVTLSAAGDVSSRGAAVSANSVAIQAGGTLDNAAGSLWSATGMQVGAQRVANQGGLLGAVGDVAVTAGSVDNGAGTIGSQTGHLNVNSTGAIANAGGKLVAGQDVSLTGTSLGNQGGTVSARNLSINTGTGGIDNTGGTVSAAGTAAIGAGALVNRGGTLAAVGDVSLKVGRLDNTSGALGSQTASLKLDSTGDVVNAGGKLVAAQDASIAAASLNSQGGMVSARNLLLDARGGTIDSTKGTVSAAGTATVNAGSLINQGGTLAAVADVQANVGRLDNTGGALGSQAAGLSVTSTGAIDNAGGKLVAARDATLNAASLGNQAGTISVRNLSLNTGSGLLDNTGGTVSAAGTAALGAGALVNRGGTLAAVGDVTLKVSSLDNSSGVLGSQTAGLHLDSTGDVVNAGGKLVAAQDATIRAASLGNQAGTLSARNLQMNTGAGTLDNSNGLVSASGKADLTTGSLVNHGGTLAAAGDVTADVTGLDNTSGTLGSSAGKLSIDSASGIANAKGKLIAAQDATLNATSLNNQGGAVSARGLSIHTDSGTLDNTNGAVSASGAATIQAGNLVNQGGTVAAAGNLNATVASLDNTAGGVLGSSGGNLTVTSAGTVANAGGKLLAAQDIALSAASLGNQAGTVAGRNVTVNTGTGAMDNIGGAIAAAAALDATAGAVTNANGVLQAGTTLTAHSQSLTNTSGALIGNAVSVNSGTLANRQGTISSATTLDVQGQSLHNEQGKLVSNGTLTIHDDTVTNAGGQIASNADVTVSGTTLDNSAGLMHAGGTLLVNGASVLNKNTNTAGTGMEGANVALTATASFDNTAGAVRSDQSTQITAPAIDNTQGAIQSAGTVGAKAAGALTNTRGNLNGTRSVAVAAGRMSGDGTVQSQGSVSLDLQSDFVNTGTVAAGQDVSVTTTGNVTNSGTLSAGRNLAVSANNIANTQSGQLIGAVSNTLTARGTLSNDGLIDGGATVVRANTVVNTGRLYGDAVAIQANTLTNTVNASGVAGVIASRSDMDLGVQALNNQEHALIYTVGNLRIGGALDAGNHATGSAQSVTNGSATINADANLTIAAAQINNRNNHFATADQTSAGSHVTFYRLDGSLQNIDPSTVWLFHQNTGEWHTGADWPWLGDDDYKVMVMPSAQYPFERYGPPFDYSKEASKVAMIGAPLSFPIGAAYSPGGVCSGDNCTVSEYPEHFVYSASDRIWDVFGIARPQEIGPQPIQENYIGRAAQYAIDYAAWEQRHDAALPQYQQLNNAIAAFNRDFSHRQVDHFTIYDGTQQVTRTVVTQSDPGTITSGGSMTLNAGVVNNVASQIVAGGDLTGSNVIGTRPNNVGMQGTQTVTTTGQAIYTHVDDRDRVNDAQPWQGQTEQTQFQLDVSATSGTGPNSQHAVKSVAVAATAGQGNGGTTAVADHMTIAGGAASVAVPTGGAIHAVTSTVAAPAGSAVSAGTAAVTVPNSGAVIRTVVPSLTLPNNALYRVVRDPGSSVLVETDPRFTNFRQWTSSDAMLSQFRNDPGATLKRIGDGFYEQQLIQQQIIRATGQRFIGDYTNNEDEYKALLAAGVAAGKAFGLNVGTALTDEQMARLTTDIVWMVKQTVTLADGSQQEVLVPQVYLRAKDTDITGGGTLMAGNNVSFQAKGDVTNSGTIASRRVTVVTGDNIVNSGTLAGGTLLAQAAQDINNLGGHIQGDQVLLSAGRDVNLTSTSTSTTNATTLGTNISQVASVAAGALSIQAGRDANLTAAAVNTTGDATITAKRDVNLNALRQSSEEHINWGNQNRSDRSSYADTGTQIQSGGKLAIGAGQDVNATAAYANATGSIQVAAGRDVHLSAGQSHQDVRDEHFQKETGFMSSKTTHTIDSVSRTDAAGTTLSGDTVAVQAGRNLTVAGSTVASTNGTSLAAGNDLTVTTTQTSSSESHYREEKKSGFGATGNGLSYGNKQQTDIANDNANTYAGSLIGSTNGNVTLKAGGDLHLTGSQAVAGGDLTAIGRNVTIDAAAGTTHHDETHITKSSGFTLGLSGGAAGLMQAASSQMQDAADAKDARASVLNGMAMGRSLYDAGNALGGKKPMDEVSVTLSWGTSQSKSTSTEDATRNQGSTLMAGGKATLIATGAKDANGNPVAGTGNLTIAGSGVSAKDVVLGAANAVNLVASQDTDKTRSENSSSSASVGISYGTKGFGVSASMSKAHGDSNSDAVIHNNTHVTGSDSVTIVSGGDTNLLGAQVNGGKVVANVGGNLNLASQQDTTKASSHQQSMGGGFSISQGGGSASASFTTQNGHSDYKGVQEQTGIYAGTGGFDINVKGNTDLKGAVIASAATPDKNTLTTGTLSFSDIHNHAEYSASSFGLSGGVGYQSEKKSGETSKAESEEPRKKAAPGGFSPMLPLMSSGSADSTTRSAVAEGTINITNQAQQKQDIATLSRDTSNTNSVLDKNPDLGEILSRQAELQKAASAAGEAVARTIGDIADSKRDDALAEAEKAHKAGNEELANKYRAEADQWKEGGEYRAGLHMAGGALVAGLGGGSAIGGAIGAGAASLAAPQLTELADKVASSVGGGVAGQMAGNVVANVAAGAVGSVGGGSGAFMGSNVDRYNRQLHEKETSVIRNKARQLAAAGGISYDDALERLSSQALRDVDAEYAAAHPGVDMQAQAWLNQLKVENPEGFNHMPLFQATRAEYNDSTLYAGTKLTSPDIYAAANRPTIPGTISPNRVNLMPLVTGNAKSLANTGIEVLNKGMAIVSGPLGPDVSMPLIPMTEEERAAAGATAVMAAPFGVRGSVAAADANTAAATGRAADAANAARASETPTWTANGGAYSQSSAGAGTPVTTVRAGPGYSAADAVPGRAVGETANAGAKGVGAFADEAKLIGHFEKHGAEFGTKSASEYLQVGQDIMQYGQKVEYLYKGETRTGFVQFMGNRANGQSKFGFVGTNADGAITTIHTESGNSFWKMLNNGNIDKVIKPVP
ncbi:filamentous hemagglutinin N-terminal domain-containing protein [Ralstonia solanacearum]|uniref:hemagglutinin repeat-containing protein n=14 Tax=Ralstonia pseudosolanacearum TaxID=1310165 RepID=UPI001570784A|nr:hemagglutinin repeat-containing protein [Ralstonia pseudosolanacearum]MDO3518013.1 hemagglutinin repeat-containing protein [Ralstonia pseudosolanacearum]QKL52064.1 filamentous hemagglutinin N-terminal domain-containing protein [Ralstonia solanacearum]QKM23319.1 filamentous hemagglutinin N-terminal domain-containing protein [Ralstonia solanacearum]QKM28127.1 filamentous hemagglutinin N-terminal domain-containing protein [Ralstonia solanacearum]